MQRCKVPVRQNSPELFQAAWSNRSRSVKITKSFETRMRAGINSAPTGTEKGPIEAWTEHGPIEQKLSISCHEQAHGLRQCSCPYAIEHYICKHSIAVEMLKYNIDFSETAKALPLGFKAGRGRPKKTGFANGKNWCFPYSFYPCSLIQTCLHLHITNKQTTQLNDSDNSSFCSMGAVFRQGVSLGAMLRQRAPMGAVFSPDFYGGPFQYLWWPFSILSQEWHVSDDSTYVVDRVVIEI